MPKYRIAELLVEYEPRYERLRKNSLPYLVETDQEPDMKLALTDEFLDQADERYPTLGREDCEYFFIGQHFYYRLLDFGGCMVHSSAVAMDDRAYLFTAPSGTGKSTHTSQWQKAFGVDRAQIINDDKPAVRRIDGVYYAYGTPFSGKSDMNINTRVPLGAICIVERGERNAIARVDTKEATLFFLTQTVRSIFEKRMDSLLTFMDGLLSEIPVYKMQCDISTDAARMAYEAMRD